MTTDLPEDLISNPKFIQAVKDECWFRGDLEHILRPNAQTQVYKFTHEWKEKHKDEIGPLVWNCHRGMGKSHLLLVMCIERCLRYPNQEVRFGSPTGVQTADIAGPILRKILNECPKALKPKPNNQKKQYVFKNPRWEDKEAISTLTLVSCKDDAEKMRGPRSDMVVLDECRNIPNFKYVVDDVFWYHFAQRFNPLLILSSTPPASMDHSWVTKYLDSANRDSRYFIMPIDKNPDFTQQDREMLLDVCETEDTTSWKREALCQLISDESALIVPEFQKVRDITVVDTYPRPEYFFPHTCVDFGWVDNTAVLFGYVDFEAQQLVIEDEYVSHYKTIGEIAYNIKEKEGVLYQGNPYPVRRFGDNDQLELANLRLDYGLPITAAAKIDRESSLAQLRTKIQEGRVKIFERCKQLIYQLSNGLKDEKGRFVRTEKCGHCDAIAALVYLNRMINWNANPFPFKNVYDPHSFENPFKKRISKADAIKITRSPLVVIRR